MKKLKILSLTTFGLPPLNTGAAIVAFNTLKHLSSYHQLHMLCCTDKENISSPEYADSVDIIRYVPPTFKSKIFRHFSILFGSASLSTDLLSNSVKEKINVLIVKYQPDLIITFELPVLHWIEEENYKKVIANIEDPQSIKNYRMAKLKIVNLSQKIRFLVTARIISQYEKHVLPLLNKVILLSSSDVEDMIKSYNYINLAHIPYGIEVHNDIQLLNFSERENAIVFSGNMYHLPNVDGALFLLNEILPHVLKVKPNVTLWIVGSNPDARIYQSASKYGNKVIITGKVDSIDDYLKKAKVSICPVRLKIGVQTKILEALYWGTPVVTTSAGNSGIKGTNCIDMLVEDEPTKIAEKIICLLNGESWDKLSFNGKNFLKCNFSWKNSFSKFDSLIDSIT